MEKEAFGGQMAVGWWAMQKTVAQEVVEFIVLKMMNGLMRSKEAGCSPTMDSKKPIQMKLFFKIFLMLKVILLNMFDNKNSVS